MTIPFKRDVMALLDDVAPSAAAAGAVNTIAIRDGRWVGMNTDITEKKQAERELRRSADKLAEEKRYLEREISAGQERQIIGRSAALVSVMDQVARVAPADLGAT